jgi:hypothetical protein
MATEVPVLLGKTPTSTTYKRLSALQGFGSGRHFPGREKQDVFPAAPRDGFTAAREMPS